MSSPRSMRTCIAKSSREVEYIWATLVQYLGASDKMSDSGFVILTMVGSYVPGYKAGGPIRSISNLATVLGEEFRFKIVTLDRDLGDTSPYPGVEAGRWLRVGNADVMYLSPGWRGLFKTVVLLRSVDRTTVLYLNSFFARRFSILPIFLRWFGLLRPGHLMLAPRGEFSPGALKLKPIRKFLYLTISRWLGLYENIIWHASTEREAADIGRCFSKLSDIRIANVLPGVRQHHATDTASVLAVAEDIARGTMPAGKVKPRKQAGQLRAVFVSRISPKKNLLGALQMLQSLSGDITFDIYGPQEDTKYWDKCQGVIASLPINVRVKYAGKIEHERVREVFAGHDLFLFPTQGENYGHVICEALSAGCPVLISDQTPWLNLEDEGVGWDIPLSQMERFCAVLQQCVDADDECYSAMSDSARAYAQRHLQDPAIIEANRGLLQYAFLSVK